MKVWQTDIETDLCVDVVDVDADDTGKQTVRIRRDGIAVAGTIDSRIDRKCDGNSFLLRRLGYESCT